MWPVIIRLVQTYAPYIVWPAAVVVGFVGYNIESVLRKDQQTPWSPSTADQRIERQTREGKDLTKVDSLKYNPNAFFERNKSKSSS
jgi:hypothetical protein